MLNGLQKQKILRRGGKNTSGAEARRTPCPKGSGQEELPHVRGQGQKPGGPHARGAAAKKSYPRSKVRGSGRECQAATVQERPRGAIPRPRPEAVAGRNYPTSKERCLRGWQEGLRGATPRSRSGGAMVSRYPSSKVRSSGCALLEQP